LLTKFENVSGADNKLQTSAGVRDSVTVVAIPTMLTPVAATVTLFIQVTTAAGLVGAPYDLCTFTNKAHFAKLCLLGICGKSEKATGAFLHESKQSFKFMLVVELHLTVLHLSVSLQLSSAHTRTVKSSSTFSTYDAGEDASVKLQSNHRQSINYFQIHKVQPDCSAVLLCFLASRPYRT
jgi:hypothetical protein